jgi:16S rRNA (guanine527-N7)-methyltransferase
MLPQPHKELVAYFGDFYPQIERFAALLVDQGITRGVIGPREADRIWDRHIANCAAVCEVLPPVGAILDLGSGAGLPGIVIAIMRPSQQVVLLESLQRRVNWLTEVAELLELQNVTVVRGRAGERLALPPVVAVTARAVATLDKLMTWSAPILPDDGALYALKGDDLPEEIAAVREGKDAKKFVRDWQLDQIEIWNNLPTVAGVTHTTIAKVPRR